MPHCIVEYSAQLAQQIEIEQLVQAVHSGAIGSELFDPASIKTRCYPSEHVRVGNLSVGSFIHITLKIMPGRTPAQKQHLSETIYQGLAFLCCDVNSITIEVLDIEQHSYFKRLNP